MPGSTICRVIFWLILVLRSYLMKVPNCRSSCVLRSMCRSLSSRVASRSASSRFSCALDLEHGLRQFTQGIGDTLLQSCGDGDTNGPREQGRDKTRQQPLYEAGAQIVCLNANSWRETARYSEVKTAEISGIAQVFALAVADAVAAKNEDRQFGTFIK